MNTLANPDALPGSETHTDPDNRAVFAEEAVTTIASPLAPRVQADVRNLSLTVLTVLAVIFVLHWARAFFIPLMLGIMISYAFSPLVNRMQKWRIPRAIGAAVLLAGIVGGAGSLVYSLSDDAIQLIETLPEAAQKFRKTLRKEWGTTEGAMDQVQQAAVQLERAASETINPDATAPQGVTRVLIEKSTLNVSDYLWTGTVGAAVFAGQAVMVLFLTYFLLVSGDIFRRKLVRITGPTLSKKKITVQVLDEITAQIQRYLLVQIFTSVLVGVATWLAFLWIGLDNAAIWGIVSAVFNLIPYLGPVVVTGGTGLVGFLQFGTVGMALTVAGISLVITSLEGYLLTPWLTGRAGRMNAVMVFVGVLFWGWLWGVWGLLLGVPIIMVIKAICDRVEDYKPIGELLGK
ncbi:MAG: AI-2E family transporter [Hydrogenophilales bacterium 12-61-10]|nr:MAG: AI-2E family transporter [Hydrogenophilales bacterium 12-61-10]